MNNEDAEKVQSICEVIVNALVGHPEGDSALLCVAALGVTLAALSVNAKEQNDTVFAFGIDTAVKIYENKMGKKF